MHSLLLKIPRSPLVRTALVTGLVTSLIACIELGADSTEDSQKEQKAQVQLKESSSQAEFKKYMTTRYTQKIEPTEYDEPGIMENAIDDGIAFDAAETEGSEASFSSTNNQVVGVDEGDLWKYDGENFFVLKRAAWDYNTDSPTGCNNIEPMIASEIDSICLPEPTLITPAQIRIVKNTQEQLATLEIDNINPNELYLHDHSLVVLGNRSNYKNNWNSDQNWQEGQNTMTIIDVQKKAEPTVKFSLALDGYLVQSRRIGDEIFLISRYNPHFSELEYSPQTDEEVENNKRIIDDLSLSDFLPKITINDQQHDLITDNTCLIPDTSNSIMASPSLTMITRININTAQFSSSCMAGEVAGIYMSQKNLYAFNTSYWNFSDTLAESLHWTAGNTHLHKFDLASFNYLGSALIEGQLASNNPRLRLGELKDGSIAVVTSKKSVEGDWRLTNHQLTVLNNHDGQLKQIAHLPNDDHPEAIGKVNEQIYSVRFMQDRAYIVTFQKVDPLYVIDLSNPAQPSIAGELEIPGYSDYLHPIGNDLLLGIGKDAKVGQSGTTWYQGVKVSLFDVKDIQQPTELGNILIGKRGSSTALSYDLHSFTGIQQDDQYRFALPISVNEGPVYGNNNRDPESQYYQWSKSGLYLFEIKDNQLSQAGALITDVSSEDHLENSHWSSYYSRRGLIQADDIYHLNGSDLYKANWHHPEQMSEKF